VIVPYSHVIVLSGILFFMGMFCTVVRRNLIMVLLGLEIMLNAAAVAFVGASLRWQLMDGQALVIFIIAVAATEVSVGLAMVVATYRQTGSVDPEMLEEKETSG
jgi:NADH-quinone oxidoreductase subunit K